MNEASRKTTGHRGIGSFTEVHEVDVRMNLAKLVPLGRLQEM
jgi:hypothetical protein